MKIFDEAFSRRLIYIFEADAALHRRSKSFRWRELPNQKLEHGKNF